MPHIQAVPKQPRSAACILSDFRLHIWRKSAFIDLVVPAAATDRGFNPTGRSVLILLTTLTLMKCFVFRGLNEQRLLSSFLLLLSRSSQLSQSTSP